MHSRGVTLVHSLQYLLFLFSFSHYSFATPVGQESSNPAVGYSQQPATTNTTGDRKAVGSQEVCGPPPDDDEDVVDLNYSMYIVESKGWYSPRHHDACVDIKALLGFAQLGHCEGGFGEDLDEPLHCSCDQGRVFRGDIDFWLIYGYQMFAHMDGKGFFSKAYNTWCHIKDLRKSDGSLAAQDEDTTGNLGLFGCHANPPPGWKPPQLAIQGSSENGTVDTGSDLPPAVS